VPDYYGIPTMPIAPTGGERHRGILVGTGLRKFVDTLPPLCTVYPITISGSAFPGYTGYDHLPVMTFTGLS